MDNKINEFEKRVNIARKNVGNFCTGNYSLRVPVQPDDPDQQIVSCLEDLLDYAKSQQTENAKLKEEVEILRRLRNAVGEYKYCFDTEGTFASKSLHKVFKKDVEGKRFDLFRKYDASLQTEEVK